MKSIIGKLIRVLGAVLLAGALVFTGVNISDTPSQPSVAVGKYFITIGTVEASTTVDYTSTGTNDNGTWQTALNALPAMGGQISGLAGVYVFAANVQVTRAIANVTFQGVGSATYIKGNGVNATFTAGGNNWVFRDIKFDVAPDMGATTGWLWENVWVGSTYYAIKTPTTTTGASYSIPTGRTGYVIAASNAPAIEKAQADIVVVGDYNTEVEGAISAGYTNIRLTSGTFVPAANINIPSGVTITGAGENVTYITAEANTLSNVFTLLNADNSRLSGMTIDGNWDVQTDNDGSNYNIDTGVLISGCNNTWVENVRVIHARRNAFACWRSFDSGFKYCTADTPRVGAGFLFADSWVNYQPGASISRNNSAMYCRAYNVVGASSTLGSNDCAGFDVADGVTYTNLIGCYGYGCQRNFVVHYHSQVTLAVPIPPTHTLIKNFISDSPTAYVGEVESANPTNTFADDTRIINLRTVNANGTYLGLTDAQNVVVDGAYFSYGSGIRVNMGANQVNTDWGGKGIRIINSYFDQASLVAYGALDLTVENCRFYKSPIDGIYLAAGNAVKGNRNIKILYNTITQPTSSGVHFRGIASDVKIIGNDIQFTGKSQTYNSPIFIQGEVGNFTNFIVTDNTCKNPCAAAPGIYVTSAAGYGITGLKILNNNAYDDQSGMTTTLTANVNAGALNIRVTNSTYFKEGQMVTVGDTAASESVQVDGINGGNITLATALANSYTTAASGNMTGLKRMTNGIQLKPNSGTINDVTMKGNSFQHTSVYGVTLLTGVGSQIATDAEIISKEFDLSDTEENPLTYTAAQPSTIVGYSVTWSEAAGDANTTAIQVGRITTGGVANTTYYDTVTTAGSEALNTVTWLDQANLSNRRINAGESVTVGHTQKAGAGKVKVNLYIVENCY